MGLFDEVKQNVTVRQAVELYGLKPNRSGLIRCIFHNDKSPSMKVDRRYYCFGCGCTGDAIDFTAQLFGIGSVSVSLPGQRTQGSLFPLTVPGQDGSCRLP